MNTPDRPRPPTISKKAIALLWSEFYQGTGDTEKMSRAYDVIRAEYHVPWAAYHAIGAATHIHGGDMGVPTSVLQQLMECTGMIESGYATRVQYGGGPARSFWQVEPETARDLLKNSKRLCGTRWYNKFGYNERVHIIGLSNNEIADVLETYDDLAASIAAMKWIVSAHKAIKQTLKQQERALTKG